MRRLATTWASWVPRSRELPHCPPGLPAHADPRPPLADGRCTTIGALIPPGCTAAKNTARRTTVPQVLAAHLTESASTGIDPQGEAAHAGEVEFERLAFGTWPGRREQPDVVQYRDVSSSTLPARSGRPTSTRLSPGTGAIVRTGEAGPSWRCPTGHGVAGGGEVP